MRRSAEECGGVRRRRYVAGIGRGKGNACAVVVSTCPRALTAVPEARSNPPETQPNLRCRWPGRGPGLQYSCPHP